MQREREREREREKERDRERDQEINGFQNKKEGKDQESIQ